MAIKRALRLMRFRLCSMPQGQFMQHISLTILQSFKDEKQQELSKNKKEK